MHDVPRVLMIAGGSGGHIFPGLSVAKGLRAQGCEVSWLGSETGMERQLVAQDAFPLYVLPMVGARRMGLLRWLRSLWVLVLSIIKSIRIIRKLRPSLVIGMGGFAALPGALAAIMMRIPLVIHEQNATPSLTNRVLVWGATRVFTAFPNTFAPRHHPEVVGNPLREEVLKAAGEVNNRQSMDRTIHILVLGGSQGASFLNQMMPTVVRGLHERGIVLALHHQTGPADVQATQAAYDAIGVSALVEPFIQDVAFAYQNADLVVCRSGALTISELACMGKPSILIPFPYAVDDHQTKNAQFLVSVGGACMEQQQGIDIQKMVVTIADWCLHPEILKDMGDKARLLSRPQATSIIVQYCMERLHAKDHT